MENEPRKRIVEHTSPAWRLTAVGLFFGGLFFGGWAARIFQLEEEFSTFFVITFLVAIGFWARKRPDKLQRRFGPFGKVARALQESADDIRASIYSRSIYYGVIFGAAYALLVIVLKEVVLAVVTSLYAWQILAMVACLVASGVVAPQFLSAAAKRLSIPDEDPGEAFREVESGEAGHGKVRETPPEVQSAARPEEGEEARGEFGDSEDAAIGFYDEEGNALTAKEFEELFARGRGEDK